MKITLSKVAKQISEENRELCGLKSYESSASSSLCTPAYGELPAPRTVNKMIKGISQVGACAARWIILIEQHPQGKAARKPCSETIRKLQSLVGSFE